MDVLFENEDVWVYNKPSGAPVLKDRTGTPDLWSMLKQGPKPYLVHRLDKGTSGAWAVAKNQTAQARLTRAFERRQTTKFYVAIVDGSPPENTHHIDLPLTKGRKSRFRIAGERAKIKLAQQTYRVTQDREGLAARTSFRKIANNRQQAILILKPHTGRTHQIRVHLAWLGFPIKGDSLYHPQPGPEDRLYLHAHYLRLPGLPPVVAPAPGDFYV